MSHPNEESPETMQRRELLRRAAWLLGGAISAPAALAFLQGCAKKDTGESPASWTPQFLGAHELSVITVIVDLLIPKTETSGALDAGVPQFIDSAMMALYAKPDQERFKSGLAEFEAAASAAGKPFLERDAAAQAGFIRSSLEAALAGERDPKSFILVARELALLGYFSSKVGITDNMDYVAVPTAFHGCVPLSQMKKPVYWES